MSSALLPRVGRLAATLILADAQAQALLAGAMLPTAAPLLELVRRWTSDVRVGVQQTLTDLRGFVHAVDATTGAIFSTNSSALSASTEQLLREGCRRLAKRAAASATRTGEAARKLRELAAAVLQTCSEPGPLPGEVRAIANAIVCLQAEIQEGNDSAVANLAAGRTAPVALYPMQVIAARKRPFVIAGTVLGEAAAAAAFLQFRLEETLQAAKAFHAREWAQLESAVVQALGREFSRRVSNSAAACSELGEYWLQWQNAEPTPGESTRASLAHLQGVHRGIGATSDIRDFLSHLAGLQAGVA